jgi:urease accessory protein
MNSHGLKRCGIIILLLILCVPPLWAHQTGDVAGGLLSGFLHPITGLDHVVAMVAVGLWGAQLKRPAIWMLPIVFPMIMAFGGSMGVAGVPLPGIEIGIAISAIVLGIMVLFAVKPPLWVAIVIVAFFAIFHGHAHGTELPGSAQPLAYGVGFVTTTGLLHVSGIAIGTIYKWKQGQWVVRALGAGIGLVGMYFLITAVL